MAAVQFGILSCFDHNVQTWRTYKSRITQYFVANDITEVTDPKGVKRKAILLSALNEGTHQLVADLARPEEIENVPYKGILLLLDTHFNPKRVGFGERHNFYAATQLPGESHIQWAARLRGLTTHCNFLNLEETLRDKFIMGMRPGFEKEKIYSQNLTDLTLVKVVELAENLWRARSAAAAASGVGTVSDVVPEGNQVYKIVNHGKGGSAGKVKCSVCGYKNHKSSECKFANYVCKGCHVKGHLRRMCTKVNFMDVDGDDNGEDDDDGTMISPSLLGFCSGGEGAVGSSLAAALQFFAASQCLLAEPWPHQAYIANESRFDFIVVGAGTAGATLAARLTELAGVSVLLVEAGGDPPHESVVPGFRDVLKGSEYDWNFTSVNDNFTSQSLAGGRQRQPRGRMLGGSGSLNDMVYARGFPADYHEWAAIAGDEWAWDTVLDYFKKTEHLTDETIINNPELMKYHGRGGAIEVGGLNESTFDTDRFLDAFEELGFNIVDDMTNPDKVGAGRFSHTIRAGRRDSSATALLNKAGTNPNLYVLKKVLATKVLIENGTAYGVEVSHGFYDMHYYAHKEVIVSAGTFNTPKILMMSGIGPRDHLVDLGIKVERDLPVGDNLHDHVMVLTYLAADNGTCFTNQGAVYMDMIRYMYDRTGMFSYSNSMGAYVSLSGNPNVPDFAIYPVCIPIQSNFLTGCESVLGFDYSICSTLDKKNQDHELLSLAVVLLKPKSRGNIRLQSTDPRVAPLIYSGTFNNPDDLSGFPLVMEIAYSIANTSYFKQKNAHVVDLDISACSEVEGREALSCKAKAIATSAWHAVGTAALGRVLDARLRVRGVRALRVADASVMPSVVRGNTNAPVVMIAEMAADFIKQDYKDQF